jgi:hypothetical protein
VAQELLGWEKNDFLKKSKGSKPLLNKKSRWTTENIGSKFGI